MPIGVLLCATMGFASWGLWVRRHSWAYRWERSVTGMIVMAVLAVVLLSPLGSWACGPLLHTLTGRWNLEDYAGCMFGIGSSAAAVYCSVRQLRSTDWLRRSFYRTVTLPMHVVMPILFVLYWNSRAASSPELLVTVSTGGWLKAYWVLLNATYIYLLGYTLRGLLTLRRRRDLARQVPVYMRACIAGIVACVLRLLLVWWPHLPGGRLAWALASAWCVVGFIVGAVRGWHTKKDFYLEVRDTDEVWRHPVTR